MACLKRRIKLTTNSLKKVLSSANQTLRQELSEKSGLKCLLETNGSCCETSGIQFKRVSDHSQAMEDREPTHTEVMCDKRRLSNLRLTFAMQSPRLTAVVSVAPCSGSNAKPPCWPDPQRGRDHFDLTDTVHAGQITPRFAHRSQLRGRLFWHPLNGLKRDRNQRTSCPLRTPD